MTISFQNIIDLYRSIDTYRAKYYLTDNSWAFHGEQSQKWTGTCEPGNRKLTIYNGTTRYTGVLAIDTSLYDYFMIDAVNTVTFNEVPFTIKEYNGMYNIIDYFLSKSILFNEVIWNSTKVYLLGTEVCNVQAVYQGEPYLNPKDLGTAYRRYLDKLKASYYAQIDFNGDTASSAKLIPNTTAVIDLSGVAEWTGTVSALSVSIITDIQVPTNLIQKTAVRYMKFDSVDMVTVPDGNYIATDYIQTAKTYVESMNDGDPFWTSADDIEIFDWVREDDITGILTNLNSIPPNNGCTVACDTNVAACVSGYGAVSCTVCDVTNDGYVGHSCFECYGYQPCTCYTTSGIGCNEQGQACSCNQPCDADTQCDPYGTYTYKVADIGCTCDIRRNISYDPCSLYGATCGLEFGDPILCSWCYLASDANCIQTDRLCGTTDVLCTTQDLVNWCGCNQACNLEGIYAHDCDAACYSWTYSCSLDGQTLQTITCTCYTACNVEETGCICDGVDYALGDCKCEGNCDIVQIACTCEYCDEEAVPCSCYQPTQSCYLYAPCNTCDACNGYVPETITPSTCMACNTTVQY